MIMLQVIHGYVLLIWKRSGMENNALTYKGLQKKPSWRHEKWRKPLILETLIRFQTPSAN